MRLRARLSVSVVLATVLLLAAAAPALAVECPPPPPPPPCSPDCRTPGYWKTHPEAWPVSSITIGGVTYSKAGAIAKLWMPDGDKRQTMFRALLAAKLNVLAGCPTNGISGTITAADAWMSTYGGSAVSGSSDAWDAGEPLYWLLDAYNNS